MTSSEKEMVKYREEFDEFMINAELEVKKEKISKSGLKLKRKIKETIFNCEKCLDFVVV